MPNKEAVAQSDEKSEKETKDVPIATIRDPNWIEKYARGATGESTPYDFKIHFYSEMAPLQTEDGPVNARLSNVTIVQSHRALKELTFWLLHHVFNLEDIKEKPITVGETAITRIKESSERIDKMDWEEYIEESKGD